MLRWSTAIAASRASEFLSTLYERRPRAGIQSVTDIIQARSVSRIGQRQFDAVVECGSQTATSR